MAVLTNRKSSYEADTNPDIDALDETTTTGKKCQTVGIDFGVVSGGLLTPRRVSASDPLPVTISGTMVTFTATRPSIPNNTSTQVIAANTSRKSGSYLVNNTDSTFWLAYGAAAVLNQGVFLEPGQIFKFDTTQELRAIQNSGGALNLDCFEAT